MKYKLLADFGSQEFDPIGLRHGLKAGAVGTVVDKVPAGERGAHNDREDAIVLEFDDESRRIGKDGSVEVLPAKRRVAFAASLFGPGYTAAEQYSEHVDRIHALRESAGEGVEPVPDHTGPLFERVS